MVLDEPGAPRALRQHCLEVGVPGQEQGPRREVLTERIPLRQVMAVPILLWTGQGPSASDEDRAVQASVVFRCEHPAAIQHLGVCRKLRAGAEASTFQFLVAEQRTGQACRTGRVIFLGEEFIDRVAAVGGGGGKAGASRTSLGRWMVIRRRRNQDVPRACCPPPVAHPLPTLGYGCLRSDRRADLPEGPVPSHWHAWPAADIAPALRYNRIRLWSAGPQG